MGKKCKFWALENVISGQRKNAKAELGTGERHSWGIGQFHSWACREK